MRRNKMEQLHKKYLITYQISAKLHEISASLILMLNVTDVHVHINTFSVIEA